MTATAAAAPPQRRRRWLRLSDRPIRSKLTLLLAVPLVAILALSLVIGVGGASAAGEAEQARRLVGVGVVAGELTAQLQRERAAAASVFAQSSQPAAIEAYRSQAEATDAVIGRFLAGQRDLEAPAGLTAPLLRLNVQVAGLPLVREQVRSGQDATGTLTSFRYRALTADLGAYRTALSQLGVDAATANGLRATATVSQAIEALGLMQVAVLPAIGSPRLTATQQQQIVGANAAFNQALEAFRQIAPARWQAQLAGQSGSKIALAGERLQSVAAQAQAEVPLTLGAGVSSWASATNARMQQLHDVEHRFDTELLASVTRQRDQQRRNLFVLVLGVAVVLAALGAVGWRVSASITGPLRALQADATAMASTHLPAVVARLSAGDSDVSSGPELVAGVMGASMVTGADEVAQVRRAFSLVGETAIELAGQQATARSIADRLAAQETAARQLADQLAAQEATARAVADQLAAQEATARAVVSEIVINVARRLQGLVSKLMNLIDVLERNEEDPDRLEKIFLVDHQANKSHRYIQNLLIIAGQQAGSPGPADMPLHEVIRGAAGRLEDYTQIEPRVDATIVIHRDAVEDLVHLFTELFANAVAFSPPGSLVEVVADVLRDGLRVAIIDRGTGIRADLIDGLLQRIRGAELDAQAVRQMGLIVVGRIAARLRIGVDIRSGQEPGTVIELRIPSQLFLMEEPAGVRVERAQRDPGRPTPPPPIIVGPLRPAPASGDLTQVLSIVDATREFPIVGARPVSDGTVAAPSAETLIFQQVVHDNPWFSNAASATRPLPAFSPAWPAAVDSGRTADAAHPASGSPAPATTVHGLPKRIPRMPPPAAPAGAVVSRRDPKTTSKKLAAFAAATRASRTPR